MSNVHLIFFVAIATTAAGVGFYAWFLSRGLLQHYWQRSCAGKAWKQQFPSASNDDIRGFLGIFTTAFLFKSKKRLKFHPDDNVMAIYRAVYPMKNMPDSMELESFAMKLKKQYDIDLYAITNHEITLGELFRLTRTSSK
jgi:propanediol dehydratase small subunit